MNKGIEFKTGNINDPPGDIIFSLNYGELEMVRLCVNGDIRVKGKLIENDKKLVNGLREFLKLGKIERRKSKIKELWKKLVNKV